MARLESVAVGGYYPTPSHLIPMIVDLLTVRDGTYECCLADPCAGDGNAILSLGRLLGVRKSYLTCELENERYEALRKNLQEGAEYGSMSDALHGDAFMIELPVNRVSLLYLNPPYDTDPVHGRLEQRFLDRFTQTMVDGGILVFVVPFYALKASAQTLATEYSDLQCFRFPGEDFEAYSQVVLIGRKSETLPGPDAKTLAQVLAWSESADRLPQLGRKIKARYTVPEKGYSGHLSLKWRLREIDLVGLVRRARPWTHSGRSGQKVNVPHVLPDLPVQDLMFRTFPLATAPRPAHIAAGIASGLFNGRRVNAKTSGMPDLLVKGVFDREYVTVEEKHNREGEVTSIVQVQQPKLVTTVLDLSQQTYTTLKSGAATGSRDVSEMSIEDLLEHYGPSLMRVMAQQCPVTYDAKRDNERLPLASISRRLFTAQENASKALVSLLGGVKVRRQARRGRAAILLGEIGSGKTSVALSVGRTIARRMLVMCPPHLLDSWRDEAQAVLPEAEYRVLQNVSDVDALADIPEDRFVVAVLSRETAKLGHGMESVTGACPACGAALPLEDLAKKRTRCGAHTVRAVDTIAKTAVALALHCAPFEPTDTRVLHALRGRFLRTVLTRYEKAEAKAPWKGIASSMVDSVFDAVLTLAVDGSEEGAKLLGRLLAAENNPERIAQVVRSFKADASYYLQDVAKGLVLLLPPGSDLQNELCQADVFHKMPWNHFDDSLKALNSYGHRSRIGEVKLIDETIRLDGREPGSLPMALSLLNGLLKAGSFHRSKACGEPLYQAIPEPRRFPLSQYIVSRHPNLFDFLVLDEGHEYATDGSAQERSAHRLTALGIPTVLMTGSIMNGYAESLFSNMWALSRDFRQEFSREDRPRFVERYGYLKRVLSERDRQTGEVVEFGAHTDRVERSERHVGYAPGILPLFLFRHLLPISVTLHKADLAIDLPPCRQIKCSIEPDADVMASYKGLVSALRTQIKKDQFMPGLAGKLFGALAELPSYLDRSTLDTGNQEDGSYEIRYPDTVGGELVARAESFPASKLSAKERWMLDTLRAELAEGRNVMVFSWHVSLLARLARIISQELGEEVPILYAEKVATGKRQDWINKNVVRKGRRILVANPVCVQTGLNNLVHFATQIWMENPACNPIIFRQGIGRVDRINQRLETRIYTPVFSGTLQVQLHDLLLRKVAVSVATDGLDNESMMIAAGMNEDGYLSGLSIGKQLWNMLNAN
jgi:hypothetical protein